MAPPRAGTFIYHAHNGRNEEIASGLYGPFLVLEPGTARDPATDLVFVIAEAGPGTDPGKVQRPFVNGSIEPAPIDMEVGTTYRLRYIDISQNDGHEVSLMDGERLLQVSAIALDGADLPVALRRTVDARFPSAPGMTTDFEFTPERPGELQLVVAAVSVFTGQPVGRPTIVPIRVTAGR
jgi:FtsP/CotA-like multicopper oxidase with cupredoxin domain